MTYFLMALAMGAEPDGAQRMHELLSQRHPVSCEVVEAASSTPRQTLVWIVENVKMPSWAPMRASDCLISRHALASTSDFERWASDVEFAGVTRAMLNQIDVLPPVVAVAVGSRALAHFPDRKVVIDRLKRSKVPEVLAIVPLQDRGEQP